MATIVMMLGGNVAILGARETACTIRLADIIVDNYVVENALTERCIAETRRVMIAPNANFGGRSASMLVAAEVRLGLTDLARGNGVRANRWWSNAIEDELRSRNGTPTDDVPNRGLDFMVDGRDRAGFAWYAETYVKHVTQEDVSLTDLGYYNNLQSGLALASAGRFEKAIRFFERDIKISSNGSDAYFYKGAALLALRNERDAIRTWTQGLKNFSFGRGYPPREDCAFVVSSVYLWMHAIKAPLKYPRDV